MNIYLVSKMRIFESFSSGRLQKSNYEPIISFVEKFLAETYVENNNLSAFKELVKHNLNFNGVLPDVYYLSKDDIIFLKSLNISTKNKDYFTSRNFINLSDSNISKLLNHFNVKLFDISEIELKSVLE